MNVFVLPWRFGQKKLGVDKGALKLMSLFEKKNKNYNFQIFNNNNMSNEKYHEIFFQKKKNIKDNCLVLGGDHSIAIGSVLGSLNSIHKNVGILWIDAHPDINTLKSSKTKNIHGTPLSFITGIENSWSWTNSLKKLNLNDLNYWGIRDIDYFEKDIIKKANIIKNLDKAKEVIDKYDYIHLSLDIDGIDPKYMPSTGTPVSNGLDLNEVISILDYLIISQKNYTIDIVEYNPLLGNKEDKDITLDNIKKLIQKF